MTKDTVFAPGTARAATLESAGLPVRVHDLLSGYLNQLHEQLAPSIRQALQTTEAQLMAQAADARSSERQGSLIGAARAIHANGALLLPRLLASIESELATLRAVPSEELAKPATMGLRAITLVEDHEIDQEIVLREMARRCEARSQAALHALGLRFAALAASPAIDASHVPGGPHSLCKHLQLASSNLQVDDLEALLVLYRAFEQHVLFEHDGAYDVLNAWLAQQGVLPNLVHSPRRRRERSARNHGETKAETPNHSMLHDQPMTGWHSLDAANDWTAPPANIASSTPSGATEVAPGKFTQGSSYLGPGSPGQESLRQDADIQAPGQATGSGRASDGIDPSLSALHDFLQQRRQGASRTVATGNAGGGTAAVGDKATIASVGDLISQLSGLQVQTVSVQPGQPHRSFRDVQQLLQAGLRDEHGREPALATHDADKFELLDMLYKEIEREVRPDAPCVELLVRLQVPVARVGLLDPRFFTSGQHPVRELLNTVAESGAIWQGDEQDTELVRKLRAAVDQVTHEYDGDSTVFETVNLDIRQHLEAMARRAELNERRHIKAAQGRDQLEVSRRRAHQAIANALEGQQPPAAVRKLLDQVWHDALTLTLLRKGESSAEWQALQQTTSRIAQAIGPTAEVANPALAAQVGQSLVSAGYGESEAATFAAALSQPAAKQAQEVAESEARIESLLRGRNWMGRQPTPVQTEALPALNEEESQHHTHLLSLPFGTWFEFVQNQQGDVLRRRLSWYSQLTDNALFVNQQGQRVLETTLDKLARLMARDQARVLVQKKARLIDRAWRATVDALRTFSPRAPA